MAKTSVGTCLPMNRRPYVGMERRRVSRQRSPLQVFHVSSAFVEDPFSKRFFYLPDERL